MWDAVYPYVVALLPTVAVGTLFYFIMKYIIEGDRRERLAHSRWEADQAQKTQQAAETAEETERNGGADSHSSSN